MSCPSWHSNSCSNAIHPVVYNIVLTELPEQSFVFWRIKGIVFENAVKACSGMKYTSTLFALGNRRGQRESKDLVASSLWKEPSASIELGAWVHTSAGLDTWTSFLPLPEIEPRFLRHQACSLDTVPTELSRLLLRFTCFAVNCHECHRPVTKHVIQSQCVLMTGRS